MEETLLDELKEYRNPSSYRRELKEAETKIYILKQSLFSIPITMETIGCSTLYLIPVYNKDKKIGFVDRKGKLIIEPLYDEIAGAFYFENSIVAVSINKRWNIISSDGIMKLKDSYSDIFPSKDSQLASCCSDSKWCVFDTSDMSYIVEPGNYDRIEVFRYGFARVRKDGLWGIINSKGKLVLPTEYVDMYRWDDWHEPTTKVRKPDSDEFSDVIWLSNL